MNRRNALILGIVAWCLIIGIGVPASISSGDSPGNANLTTVAPIGPIWSTWGNWLNCTEDCGKNGKETRTRKCNGNCVEEKEVKVRSDGPSIKNGRCIATCQDCVDDPDGYDGYKCAENPDYCTDSSAWKSSFTSRCKKTCKLCPDSEDVGDCKDNPHGYRGYKCKDEPSWCNKKGYWYSLPEVLRFSPSVSFKTTCRNTCKLCVGLE